MSGASFSATARDARDDNLEEMLKHLDMKDDELDDVVIGMEEVENIEKDARWLAVGRLNTNRPFSHSAMFETLNFVWGWPKHESIGKPVKIYSYFRCFVWTIERRCCMEVLRSSGDMDKFSKI